jgi:hypothetical protein
LGVRLVPIGFGNPEEFTDQAAVAAFVFGATFFLLGLVTVQVIHRWQTRRRHAGNA